MPLNTRLTTLTGLLSLAALSIFCSPAHAALTCTVTLGNVTFSAVDVLSGSAYSSSGTVDIDCSGGASNTTYRFCGNASKGPSYTTGQRRMASGTDRLNFGLFVDSGHSIPYGNYLDPIFGGGYQFDLSTNSSGQISVNGSMYAEVPAGQTSVPPGTYSETFPVSSTNTVQYGAVPSNGSCPVGPRSAFTSFTVTATVNAKCTISAGTLAFGSTPGSITSRVDANTSVTAKCTNTTPYAIGLGNGNNASGSQRRMRLGATSAYVSYDIYTDAGRTLAWGAAASSGTCTGGTGTCVTGSGTGANQTINIYGSLPVQSAPQTGTYSDTVLVTITY